jgi:predicted metalloprotease with PDZ domain
VAVFGDAPWEHYTLLQIADSSYPGISGLEHQNSHLNIVAPAALDDPFMPSLYAHEVFHAWNVKRLRPRELVPYRYDRPQPTGLLWVSEGITDYYADLSEVRGGVIDSAQFFALTSDKIQEVSGTRPVALEDASLTTWVSPVNGTATIYYPKGSLAGLLLDVMIRDASDNRASLDQVMRELYDATHKRGEGFTNAQFWAAATRAAGGRSFTEFYRRYIDGRDPYPMAEVLPLAGMRLNADTARAPQIGVYTLLDSAGVLVTGVEPGGAAATAGVRAGDYLVSIGDIPVRDVTFAERFRAKYAAAEGGPLPIRVRRDGRELPLTATVRLVVTRVSYGVTADPAASPKAQRLRSGILRGTVER